MRKYAIILLGLISCKTTQPTQPVIAVRPVVTTPYVATWVCKHENFVISYKLQKNKTNGTAGWTTIATFTPKNKDSAVYTFTLPKTGIANYYRVSATMKKGTYTTLSIFLSNTNLK